MVKAILLLSGGLDSILAGRMLLEQKIQVEAINMTSPFCNCTPGNYSCSAAKKAADEMGVPVKIIGAGQAYLEIMKHPHFGRGSGMNACLDCRIHLLTRAREYMLEQGADFVATGEVLGERPMSQRLQAMYLIEKEAGLEGLVVRPLSAQVLPPSLPEQRGQIQRSQLQSIQGRSRKPQISMAEKMGVQDYPCPAGGCLLTVKDFALRFKELLEQEPGFGLEDAALLRIGRHFRLPGGLKAVVGRREEENKMLERFWREPDSLLIPEGVAGPSVLVKGQANEATLDLAVQLLRSYIKKSGTDSGQIIIRSGNQERVVPLPEPRDYQQFASMKIGVAES